MDKKSSRHSVNLDVRLGDSPSQSPATPEGAFRILVIGDFSGRSNRRLHAPLGNRRSILIDRDNFDEVIQELHPALSLDSMELSFTELDDFHPDRLYQRLPAFQKLAVMRNQPPRRDLRPASAGPERTNLLEQMVEESDRPVEAGDADDLAAFIKKVTAGHLERGSDKYHEEWSARIDAASAELMRGLLHDPAFQGLESAWRSVALLVDRLDTDGPLKIHLFDATKEELTTDEAGLLALFARSDNPWSVIVGNFAFGQAESDAVQLRSLARAARSARVSFVAEGLPPSGDSGAEWSAFRRSTDSVWVGLAVPRFLLRLPYGADTSPIETFAFEEMPRHEHSSYLWGNPAFCCAFLLAQAFLAEGWQMRPGVYREMEDLPVHTYEEDGEVVAKPCAEVLLTEADAQFLMDNGFMPLASMKNTDRALLVRFQSVAEPLSALAGRWGLPARSAGAE